MFAKWNIRRWAPGHARDRERRGERQRWSTAPQKHETQRERNNERKDIRNEGKKERTTER